MREATEMDMGTVPRKTSVPQILVGRSQDPEGLPDDLSPFAWGAAGSASGSIRVVGAHRSSAEARGVSGRHAHLWEAQVPAPVHGLYE